MTLIANVFAKLRSLKKHGYINVQKALFHCTLQERTWETGANTFQISMTAPLPYLLITAKDIEFGKVSLSDMENLKTIC